MEKPLFWHQGLFLQPQHLQLKDVYDHATLTPYHRHIKPNLWGVVSVDVTDTQLSLHSIDIASGEFWFPDMTYAVLGKNALLESRNFKEFFSPGESMTVYVGLKRWVAERPNVTEVPNLSSSNIVDTRFMVLKDQDEVNDLHLGGNPAQVKRMYYALRLFFGKEINHAASYDLIPVARVEIRENAISLSREYIPPCVTLRSDKILLKQATSIGDAVTACGVELGSYKRRRGIHHAEFGSRDMIYLLVLITLNRYIPYFSQLKENRDGVHPQDVYAVIRQLAGELSSFSQDISVFGADESGEGEKAALPQNGKTPIMDKLQPYRHENLWGCFTQALNLVNRLIHEITSGPDHVLELVYTDPYFTCPMGDDLFKGDFSYYLVLQTDTEIKDMVDTLEVSIKVTSPGLIPVLVERSLPGAIVEYLPVPPQELPRRTNGIYLKIDKNGEAFSNIRKERQLALFWYGPPKDLKMELMVLKEK